MLPATCEKQNMVVFENLFELLVLLHMNSTASMQYHRWDDAENGHRCHDDARATGAPQSTEDSKRLHLASTA